MSIVKVLEKQWVRTAFGAGLVVAPFVNVWITIFLNPQIPKRWEFATYWQMLRTEAPIDFTLSVLSLVIGIIMIRGTSQLGWRAALFLIGANLLHQVFNLGQNIKSSWIYGLIFVTNVVLFFFVFDQLAWKVKLPSLPKNPNADPVPQEPEYLKDTTSQQPPLPEAPSGPTPEVAPETVHQDYAIPISIDFQGLGDWAQLVSMSHQEFQMRGRLLPQFEFFFGREIEMEFTSDIRVRVKLSKKIDSDYYFEPTHMTPEIWQKIENWVKSGAGSANVGQQIS